VSDYNSHACQHCGNAIDQLQLCSCLKAIAGYVRTRTSLDFVADALFQADKDIKSLRTQLADATRKLEEASKENHNLNWALGAEGYDRMATPEEQAEHEEAVANCTAIIAGFAERKAKLSAAPAPSLCTAEEAAELVKGLGHIVSMNQKVLLEYLTVDQLAAIINADRAKR
jgi:hypothetical protein